MSVVMPTPPVIGTRSPFHIKEKEQLKPKPHAVPVAASYISEEKLSLALDEALKAQSPASEAPVASESETANLYPSAPNGEATQSASDKTPIVSFFNDLTGKIQNQAQSTFPKGYAFLEKVFNKKEPTAKDAFAIFDGICSSLDAQEYKNLPDFEGLCEKAPGLEKSLENLKEKLDSIKDVFKEKWIYQGIDRKAVPEEKYQSWLDKRDTVEKGLASLEPAIKNVDAAISSLKDELLSEEQSFSVRVITGILTGIGYVATLCHGPGVLLFSLSLSTNLGVDTRQFLLKQKIKEWEDFKKPLKKLSDEPLLTEKKVINGILADQNRTQTKLVTSVNQQSEGQAKLIQELEEVKGKLAASEAQNQRLENKLDQVLLYIAKQEKNTAIRASA